MARGPAKPRQHERYRVDLPARARLAGEFQWHAGFLMNLSRGGVCLFLKDSELVIENGRLLEIEVATIDAKGQMHNRRLKCTTVWRRGNRYGIKFVTGKKKAKPTPSAKR